MDSVARVQKLRDAIEQVIIGKSETVKLVLVGLLARGHVLIEDIPGVGKTTLARTLAKAMDCRFSRIQFTPDLLPSDIIGVSIYSNETDQFIFKPGPVFANVLLADEINRTTPRTQSALLEAMNEFQVSVDSVTHALPQPFIVLATQNPIEYQGTYPLPESQMDRFLLRARIGYPDREHEKQVLESQRMSHPLNHVRPVLSARDVLELQEMVKRVRLDETLTDYILCIAEATRATERLEVGVSPRGCLFLARAAQALALIEGRDYVLPDDIKNLAVPVLSHRIIESVAEGIPNSRHAETIIRELVATVEVPV